MAYADREVSDRPDEQYDDAIRPPLFLFLTLLLSHGLELAMTGENALISDRLGLAALVDSDFALLTLRLVLFSLFPLMMAVRLLRHQHIRLTHASLRRPFYGQCFTAAPLALLVGISTLVGGTGLPFGHLTGIALVLVAILWYLGVQAMWFARKLKVTFFSGLGQALIAMVLAFLMFVAVASLIVF
jgi:hypothetical protein